MAVISYPFLPATTGGEISTLNILNYMAQQHQVSVFTVEPYKNGRPIPHLNFELIAGMKFSPWRYVNIFLLVRLLKLIREKQAQLLFFDQPFLGWLMFLLRLFSRKKIFMRSNNIEYLRFKSMGKTWWRLMFWYERFAYRSAHLVIFVSDTDRKKAIRDFGIEEENTLLTPYGIEVNQRPEPVAHAREMLCECYRINSNEKILLFFATLSYQPNYEAVSFIADEIYPRLKQQNAFPFRVLICGKDLPEGIKQKLDGKPELGYCGFVEDINLYIDGCHLMINPLLSGGGVKTKAIDTLARNKRVLSTRNGAEGIDPYVCGDSLVVCPDYDWHAFTNAIVGCVDAPNNIPDVFYKTYSWEYIIRNLTEKKLRMMAGN